MEGSPENGIWFVVRTCHTGILLSYQCSGQNMQRQIRKVHRKVKIWCKFWIKKTTKIHRSCTGDVRVDLSNIRHRLCQIYNIILIYIWYQIDIDISDRSDRSEICTCSNAKSIPLRHLLHQIADAHGQRYTKNNLYKFKSLAWIFLVWVLVWDAPR